MMGETLVGFLKNLQAYVKVPHSRLRVVTGNESADMDSVVCALTYAYYQYIHTREMYLPIINIPAADLNLRRDICWVLKQQKVTSDLLFFVEDIQRLKTETTFVEAVLVDHNEPQGAMKKICDHIAGIVDHHDDLKKYVDAKPRIIEVTGSCSSLVTNYWSSKLQHHAMKDCALLGLAAVLIDTTNFQFKVEQPDRTALSLYKSLLSENFNIDEYFAKIRKAKDDIEGLSLKDIIRKDYKEFHFGGKVVGMGSVVKSLNWMDEEFKVDSGCVEFLEEQNLDILLVLTSWNENGQFNRQMGFVCKDSGLVTDVVSKLGELQLKEYKSSKHMVYFNQLNTQASRKQVAPAMQKALESL